MLNAPKTLTALTLMISLVPGLLEAKNAVIAITPYGTKAEQEARIRDVASFVARTVEPGEKAILLNGATGSLIGTFAVPDNPAYAHPRAKLKANADALRRLKDFAGSSDPDTDAAGRIDPMEIMRQTGRNWPAAAPANLVLIGSPEYDDPRAPAFSMKGGNVPNEGHVIADRDRSPYGAAGEEGRLANYRVWFGGVGTGWEVNERHSFHVERFWNLNTAHRGGELAGFHGDLTTLLDQAATGTAIAETHELIPTEKLEMVSFREPEEITSRPVSSDGSSVAASIYDREVTTRPASPATLDRAEAVEIGISWDCTACDLDLYARPAPGAPVIYFGNKETADGQLHKDFRWSPAISNGFETITFRRPVDLSELRIAVNFFRGIASGGVRGEIRIAIGAETWAAPLSIAATSGNGGAGADRAMDGGPDNRRAPNDAWALIDPLSVTGLTN